MSTEEYKWNIELVMERYSVLKLKFLQAEEVYRYERENRDLSNKFYFSFWEERDFESTTFRAILNDVQFSIYENSVKEAVLFHERSLIEADQKKANEILYEEEKIAFYETQLLPRLFEDDFLGSAWLLNEKWNVKYLKSQYKQFLNDKKMQILTNHFRHSRTFQPNHLKLYLLQHKADYVLPNYESFRLNVNAATRKIVEDLKPIASQFPLETEKLITGKFRELREFYEENFKKCYGKMNIDWHVNSSPLTEREGKENLAICLLLLDKKRYGCES